MNPELATQPLRIQTTEVNEKYERRKAQNRNAQRKFRSKKARARSLCDSPQQHSTPESSCGTPTRTSFDQRQHSPRSNQLFPADESFGSLGLDAFFTDPAALPLGGSFGTSDSGNVLNFGQDYISTLTLGSMPFMPDTAQPPLGQVALRPLQPLQPVQDPGMSDLRPLFFGSTSPTSGDSTSLSGNSPASNEILSSAPNSLPDGDSSKPCSERKKLRSQPTQHRNRPLPVSAADINLSDWSLLLHMAAEHGHESIVRMLLERQVDINERDSSGATALHLAARHQHDGLLRLLLENGADVNAVDFSGWTPVCEAVEVGNAAALKLLIAHGANMKLRARRKS